MQDPQQLPGTQEMQRAFAEAVSRPPESVEDTREYIHSEIGALVGDVTTIGPTVNEAIRDANAAPASPAA